MTDVSRYAACAGLVAVLLGCLPRSDQAEGGEQSAGSECESPGRGPADVLSCLVRAGWDTAMAADRAFYIGVAHGASGPAEVSAASNTGRVSAAAASGLVGQPVRVVDSVVAIYLGNRRIPFQIRLGRDSATTQFTLLVEWDELSRFPVLKWRNRVIAANGRVEFAQGVPVIYLDDEGQARIVEGPRAGTAPVRPSQ